MAVAEAPFDPNETGTGLTTLFEGEWATVRRLRKGKLVVVPDTALSCTTRSLMMLRPPVTRGLAISSVLP